MFPQVSGLNKPGAIDLTHVQKSKLREKKFNFNKNLNHFIISMLDIMDFLLTENTTDLVQIQRMGVGYDEK